MTTPMPTTSFTEFAEPATAQRLERAAAALTLDLYQSDIRLARKVLKAAHICARAIPAVAIVRPRVMTSRSLPRRVISGFVVSFGREQFMSIEKDHGTIKPAHRTLDRRRVLLGSSALAAASAIGAAAPSRLAQAQQQAAGPSGQRPNIIFIMGDDIGWFNVGAYHRGIMASRTPNLDRLAGEGMMFTDYYAEASCTAGRANFITGELPIRTA